MTVAEVMAEVREGPRVLRGVGGGVTFLRRRAARAAPVLAVLLEACRAEGLHTAVDTCGFAARDALLRLVPLVDLFLFDVKLLDDARHREWTGLPLEPILDNLRALVAAQATVRARIPSSRATPTANPTCAPRPLCSRRCPGSRASISSLSTGRAPPRRTGWVRDYPLESLQPRRRSGWRPWRSSSASVGSP